MQKLQENRTIESLDDMEIILKGELQNIAEGYISVGFYLKKTRDDELYKQKGYADVYEFAKETFGISRTWALRFMQINDQYSIDGYSQEIQEKYRGYGSSKLAEMMELPVDIRDEVPTQTTIREIREVKKIVAETAGRYEDQMDLCDIAQQEGNQEPWIKDLVKTFFKADGKDRFEQMVDWERKDAGNDRLGIEEDILEIVNPTKFKMIRLEGGNVLMTETGIRVMPYRGKGEEESYSYIDFAMAFEELFYPNYPNIEKPINEVYKSVYGAPYREEQKPQLPKEETPKKKQDVKSKRQPEAKTAARGEEIKKEEEIKTLKPENKEESKKEEQIEGQTEITKDFPEYYPQTTEEKMGQPEETIEEGHIIGDVLASGDKGKILKLLKAELVSPECGWEKWQQKVVNLSE